MVCVVWLVFQEYVEPGNPASRSRLLPWQVCSATGLTSMSKASVTVTESVTEQPFASVTTTT